MEKIEDGLFKMKVDFEVHGEFMVNVLATDFSEELEKDIRKQIEKRIARAVLDGQGDGKVEVKYFK